MIADLLRGAAAFIDAVNEAKAERHTGFSEREAGDYLDTAGVAGDGNDELEEHINTLAAKLHKIRGLAEGWRAGNLDGIGQGDLVLHVAAGTLLEILNEGINFWTPPEDDDVVDAKVHCDGCKCPTICGCGREIYAEPDHPGDRYPAWFHRDDDSAIGLGCAQSDPGEDDDLGSPSPGDRPADFDALTAAYRAVTEWVDRPDNGAALIGCTPAMVAGVAVNAYRAALMSVSDDDLAAHITADLSQPGGMRPTEAETFADCVASSLLDDFHITEK